MKSRVDVELVEVDSVFGGDPEQIDLREYAGNPASPSSLGGSHGAPLIVVQVTRARSGKIVRERGMRAPYRARYCRVC